MNLSEAIRLYVEWRKRDKKPDTVRADGYVLGQLLRLGDRDIREVDAPLIAAFRNECEIAGLKPASINQARLRLSWFFTWAASRGWGVDAYLVMAGWRDRVPVPAVEGKPGVQKDELLWAYEIAEDLGGLRMRAAAALHFGAGISAAVIKRLLIRDVNLCRSEIKVDGKYVTIPLSVVDELDAWLNAYRAAVPDRLDSEAYVIPSRHQRRADVYLPYAHYGRLTLTLKAIRDAVMLSRVSRSDDSEPQMGDESGETDDPHLVAPHIPADRAGIRDVRSHQGGGGSRGDAIQGGTNQAITDRGGSTGRLHGGGGSSASAGDVVVPSRRAG